MIKVQVFKVQEVATGQVRTIRRNKDDAEADLKALQEQFPDKQFELKESSLNLGS